jgi:hypothetical protein
MECARNIVNSTDTGAIADCMFKLEPKIYVCVSVESTKKREGIGMDLRET